MQAAREDPDTVSSNAAFSAYEEERQPPQAVDIVPCSGAYARERLSAYEDERQPLQTVDTVPYSSASSAYEKERPPLQTADTVPYSAAFSASEEERQPGEALVSLQVQAARGEPDTVSYNAAISACERAFSVEEDSAPFTLEGWLEATCASLQAALMRAQPKG